MKNKVLRIVILFSIIGIGSFIALFYLNKEISAGEQRRELVFEDHVNNTSSLLKKKLDRKQNALLYLVKFFSASQNVSNEEFKAFSQALLDKGELSQICWKDTSEQFIYSTLESNKELCVQNSLIDNVEIIQNGEDQHLSLTEFATSYGGEQQGAVSIYFNLGSLFETPPSSYYEEVFITDVASDQLASYRLSNVESKEYLSSEIRELINLGSLKMIYFAKRPKVYDYFYGEYDAALISLLLFAITLMAGFYFWNSQARHEQIKNEVVKQTKKISKVNKKFETLNSRYRLALSASQVGIWDWDLTTNFMLCDEMIYIIYGFNKNETDQTALEIWQEAIHSDDKDRVRNHLIDCLKNKYKFDVEYRIRWPNQEIRYIRSIADIFYDEDNRAFRMVGANWDITEPKLMENELKRSNEDLDQFAYIASHDLREPLRGMRNFSQFLIDDYSDTLDEEGKGYLDVIQKLGKRLEKYLDSLLYFSRLGREKLAFKKTNLSELIPEIYNTYLDPSLKNIEIKYSSDLPSIVCDPIKLTKILGNLFQNAVRYNHSQVKIIELEYEQLGEDRHQFWVRDNGIGMKPEHWNRIFTIFKRLHPKDEYDQGSGLGLAMAKKAVEQHGGEIWVESSEVDQGSCFTFTIKEVSEFLG